MKLFKIKVTTIPGAQFGDHIPDDLILKIFLHLPAKSLLRFRSVAKHWRSLIDDPCFIDNHRLRSYNRSGGIKLLVEREEVGQELMLVDLEGNMSPTPHPATQFVLRPGYPVASVEGLICFGDIVWNPTTRKSICLPPQCMNVPVYSRFDGPLFANEYYLGFDALTKQYKVLSICQMSILRKYTDYNNNIHTAVVDKEKFQIQVFTLGTTAWRDITYRLPEEESRHMHMVVMLRRMSMDMVRVSLYLKDEVYFLIKYPNCLGLMVFSVGDETFKFLHLPSSIDATRSWAMIEVNECVALMDLGGMEEIIWILSDFDTARWQKIIPPSWLRLCYTPRFHFSPTFPFTPPVRSEREDTMICAINPGEVLVQCKWRKRKRLDCFFGDVKNKWRRRGPNLEGMRQIYSKHVETLFDPTVL